MRRFALTVLALLVTSPMALAAFPERPPRIVSGFAAGGGSDAISRIIADAISPLLGQRVAVENRTGVNGVIGAEVVARSTPDGYTAFQCPMSTLSITPQLQGANLPLDPGGGGGDAVRHPHHRAPGGRGGARTLRRPRQPDRPPLARRE